MKKILALALAVFSATPVMATGTFEEHKRLYNTIHSYGVTVKINDPRLCASGNNGSYHSRDRVLSICQDNKRGTQEIDWTPNDLDTLRHEAQHMIQDCYRGRLGDSQLAPIFGSYQDTHEFITDTLGQAEANRLMNLPAYKDASDHRKYVELEAFAVAAVISPNDIVSKMNELCR